MFWFLNTFPHRPPLGNTLKTGSFLQPLTLLLLADLCYLWERRFLKRTEVGQIQSHCLRWVLGPPDVSVAALRGIHGFERGAFPGNQASGAPQQGGPLIPARAGKNVKSTRGKGRIGGGQQAAWTRTSKMIPSLSHGKRKASFSSVSLECTANPLIFMIRKGMF